MKTIKRTLRLFIVAVLSVVFALSVAACKTGGNKPGSKPEEPGPSPVEPGPGETVKYTVSFENVDSTAYPAIQVDKNGTVSVDAPANTDTKIFLGWYMDEDYEIPFIMGSTQITQNTTLYAKWKTKSAGEVAKRYTVTFNSDGGSTVAPQSVEEGKCAFSVTPEKAGSQFLGWYLGETKYDFKNVITKDITLVARWKPLASEIKAYGGNNESLYVEWTDGAPSQASVQYKLSGESTWVNVDSELIRTVGNSVARVDAVGLTAGDYDVKIQPSSGSEIELNQVSVAEYDRSGYAHFNHTEGVGAYYDDGTIKDNALVIYVTDANKNTVKTGYVDGQQVDLTQYLYQGKAGIGWLLNNRAYSGQINNYGITKLCNTYGAVAIRFIGTVNAEKGKSKEDARVSLIDGLTVYDSEENGGTKGDNGRMARMVSAKNLTLEGIGEDATIYGWGFHLVNNDTNYKTTKAGSNFEVRNLTFTNYPEDAIGMEGNVQEPNSEYTKAPVAHCWVHNNVFLPGYCGDTSTDSDKAEGDGSCDFKRGEYFTLSYNYFDDCHKTNLVGASTSNFQYNVTFHHNWWNNAQARVPLLRNANVHFYNNYITTADDGNNDYVHGLEGTCYLFTEANYYYNSKQITRNAKGGKAKAWNNTYYGCYDNKGAGSAYVEAKSRDEKVSNNCVYRDGTSLANFDTDPNLFYYNTTTKQSDCLLDDSVTARLKVMQYAGVIGWYNNNPKKDSTTPFKANVVQNTPTTAVPVPDEGELKITLEGNSSNGVMFHATPKDGSVKGKGQIITFTLATEAEVSFTATAGSDDYLAELVKTDGTVYVSKGSDVSVVLPAGTYSISSGTATRTGNNAKEVTISNLTFKSTAGSAQAKLDNLNDAINAIGTVTLSSRNAITAAQTLLNALSGDEIAAFDAAHPGQRDKLTTAQTTYNNLLVQNVQTLISAIGTVTDDSYPDIQAARTAYDNLPAALKSSVNNYSTLTAAETAWANRAVTAVNNQISALADPSTVSTEADIKALLASYNSVKSAYETLTSAQQSEVTDYSKVTTGITQLKAALAPYDVRDMIAALPAKADVQLSDAGTVAAARTAYDNLTAAQKTLVGDITKLTEAEDAIDDLQSSTVVAIFTKDTPSLATNAGFTVSGKYNSSGSFEYNGTTYNAPLKLESSTSVTFTTTVKQKLTLKIGNKGGQLNVDGKTYKDEDNDGLIVIDDLAAGNHEIAKASGDPNLCYALLEKAA
ncbi:MAG: InlB B-repeat-containing protein [Clostridia bacterium]|nr:InlB B-repeat-containing protein [Clostridia bacterium]